jgi:hypothetical protein
MFTCLRAAAPKIGPTRHKPDECPHNFDALTDHSYRYLHWNKCIVQYITVATMFSKQGT